MQGTTCPAFQGSRRQDEILPYLVFAGRAATFVTSFPDEKFAAAARLLRSGGKPRLHAQRNR
jgi:hypothetical protein